MAARKRKRNQLPPTAPWVAKWRAGMERVGRKPKASSPKFKRISSDPRLGQLQWKGRYKRRLKSRMRAHAKRGGGARTYAKAVIRGLAASTKVNPVTYDMWLNRYVRSTGFRPFRKTTRTGRKSRRHYGPKPMRRGWAQAIVRGVKRKGTSRYARGISKVGLPEKWEKGLIGAMKSAFPKLAANPKKRKSRKGRRSSMKRYPLVRTGGVRGLMLNLVGTKKRRKGKKSRRSYSRRRLMNPVADSLKMMVTKPSLMTYAYVSGGLAVGGVIPSIVSRYLWKSDKSPMTEAAIGIVGSALAGLATAMATKNDQNGVLVAAGGLAGVVGNFLIGQLNKALGFSGLGQSAEDALKAAVESEMQRAGLTGMGQFMLPGDVQSDSGASGMGQFLTEPDMQADVAGLSGDLDASGSNAFAGNFDGSVF